MRNLLAVFCIGFIIFGSCSAQNVNAQSSNEAQRIVGTWFNDQDHEFVFNANGTGIFRPIQTFATSITEEWGAAAVAAFTANINWGVSVSGKLYISFNFPSSNNRDIMEYRWEIAREYRNDEYYLSPDGRRMIYSGAVFQRR